METQFTKREYSRAQASLLTKAMLIAGGFFLIIGGGSIGLSFAFKNVAETGNLSLWLPIMLLSMLGGMIVSMLIAGSLMKHKAGALTAFGFIIYSAIMSVTFGYLFALLKYKTNTTAYAGVAFGVTAGVFLLAALIAKITSIRGVFTMGKLIAGTSIAMGIMMLVFLILGIVGIAAASKGTYLASEAVFNLIMLAMCLVTFLYIIIDIWSISKASEFAEYAVGEEIPSSFVWYCGYKLLTDLLNVLLIVVVILIRIARRRD